MSFSGLYRAHATNIRAAAAEAGIEWPDELEAALAEAQALQQTALPSPDRQAVGAAVAEAVRDGEDPATDPRVLAALAAYQLAEACPPGILAEHADTIRREALEAHAGTIHGHLQAAVAEADEVIHNARQAVHGLDVFDNEQPARLGPDQAKAWVQGRDAALVIEHALGCWKQLAEATGQRHQGGGRYGDVLMCADLHVDQLDTLTTPRPSFRDVIAAGWRLDLATPQQLGQRVAAINEQREQQQQQRDNAFRDEFRRSRGVAIL